MILAACKDPGGLNQILPVTKELRIRGKKVVIITNGPAVAKILSSQNESFVFMEVQDIYQIPFNNVELLVTSMCGNGIGQMLVKDKKLNCIKIALQDFWGAWVFTHWQAIQYRPDYIFVNDKTDANIIASAWPDFDSNKVKITGYASFDKYASADVLKDKGSVLSKLDLDKDKKFILFAGHVFGTSGPLKEFINVLNSIKADVYLAVRFHPRMDDESEKYSCLKAMGNLKSGDLIADTSAFDSTTILKASDIVVSIYSTMLIEAAVLRKPNISILYPETGMKQFYSECPGLDEFPLVSMGCSFKATNFEELREMTIASLSGNPLLEAQNETFKLDGSNTVRITNLVESLL